MRACPDNLHVGKPNLIVCSKEAMWENLLSLYMQSPDQDLPSAVEVLVCCKSTTIEEVSLLFRRAIQSSCDGG